MKILNINHQSYTAEVIVSDHFSLQYMLIHNKPISAQILIDTDVTDDAFINSFFTCKHWFLINSIHTSLDLKTFNDQNTDHITHTVTLSMFILRESTQCTLFLITDLLKQDIIFDYSWLQIYNIIINCSQEALLIN